MTREHAYHRAQRNALDWPLTDAAQAAEHRHSVGTRAALHHVFDKRLRAVKRPCGGFRLTLVADLSGNTVREPIWTATVVAGESETLGDGKPLGALAVMVWNRDVRHGANRLLERALSEVGEASSETVVKKYGSGLIFASSPVSVSVRKAMTPAEMRQARANLRWSRTRWGRMLIAGRGLLRAAVQPAVRARQAVGNWWVKGLGVSHG